MGREKKDTLAARLKRLRDGKKWTQEELAEASGLSQESISRYETGAMEPRLDALRSLAAAFKIDAGELL